MQRQVQGRNVSFMSWQGFELRTATAGSLIKRKDS